MDFIRSLDDDENSPRGTKDDPALFVKTIERVASTSATAAGAAGAARRRPASAFPSSSFSSRSSGGTAHVPLLHRPSTLSVSDFPADEEAAARQDSLHLASLAAQQAFSAFHAGTPLALAAMQHNDETRRGELRALKAQAAAHAEAERAAAAALSASSLRSYTQSQEALMASLDAGEYFRPHEGDALKDRATLAAHSDYIEPRYESHHGGLKSTAVQGEGATAGLGPGSAAVPNPPPVAGLPLAPRLEGFKTRDLFYSQAQRAKESREGVWIKARLDPASGKHRPHEAHKLETEDFPPTRKKDPGYHAGPDADRDSAAHPDVMLGLHRLRPTAEDLAHDALLTSQSAAHHARRQQDLRVKQSVARQLAAYTDMQKRREEETVRRQEDPYRARAQATEAERLAGTNPAAASKMRPTSAPLARTTSAARANRPTSSKRANQQPATIIHEEADEDAADNESVDVTSTSAGSRKHQQQQQHLSPASRSRLDSRTALSHEDVQLLAENKALEEETQRQILIEEGLLSPFSQRPPTAGEKRRKAAAAEARYASAGAEAAAEASTVSLDRGAHIHSLSCGCTEAGGELSASMIKHQAATGARALELFSSKGAGVAPAPIVAPRGSSAQVVAAAAAATAANVAEAAANPVPLPLPFEAIEAHFRSEAWSLDRRSEGEIDALTRDFDAVLAKRERAAIAASEALEAEAERVASSAAEASIAGPAAAKIKADLRRAQARSMRDEAHEALQQSRAEARDKLRLRTEIWPPEHLGLTRLDESAADHSKAAMKARQLALGKIGAQWGKVPSHDVAFNSSVIRRKEPPPPRGAKKKEEEAPPPPPPEPEPVRGRARRSSQPDPPPPPPPKSASKKKPVVVKGRPGAYAGTKAKVVGIVESAHRPAFLQQVLERALGAEDAGSEVASAAQPPDSKDPPTSFSFSAFRGEQDEKNRRGRLAVVRPASAGMMKPTAAGGAVAASAAGSASGAPLVRPSSAFLLGHGVTHPALLKSASSRASLLSTVSSKVVDHVSRTEGLRTVEKIKDRFVAEIARVSSEEIEPHESMGVLSPRESDQSTREARSALHARLSISRRTLERALVAPSVSLDPRTQAKALPTQLSNLPVNPFLLPKKKKKRKGKGKKGSSKKKKSSSSSTDGEAKATPEAEGLAFPPGTAPGAEWISNPLVGDLAQIHLEDLVRTSQGKAELREVYLRHATQLALVWEMFSTKVGAGAGGGAGAAAGAKAGGAGGGVSLMNQFRFMQLAHISGMFEPNAVAPGGGASSASASSASPSPPPPVSSRMVYEILVDDDDLSIESIDVDELLSRPSWLERLARMAVAKLGRVGSFPPRPLGETQPIQPVPPSAASCLDRFLTRHLLPNALGLSPNDLRALMILPAVQSVLETPPHLIATQVWFSHGVSNPRAGALDLAGVRELVKEFNDPRLTDAMVERALGQVAPHAVSGGFSGLELFFPEFVELLVRLASLSAPHANPADLAQTVGAFLTRAWASFAQRVPQAKDTAAAIAASHAAQAAQATTPRARDPRVKFS